MTGVYTNLARKRVEQNETTVVPSQPALNHTAQPSPKTAGDPVDSGVVNQRARQTRTSTAVREAAPRQSSAKRSAGAANTHEEAQIGRSVRPYAPRTFNIYADQIEYLERADLEHRLAGQDISINQMVREAIDLYISQNSRKK